MSTKDEAFTECIFLIKKNEPIKINVLRYTKFGSKVSSNYT